MVMVQLDGQNEKKQLYIFSQMCQRLVNSVAQRETIDERTLRDFSKLIIWVVSNDVEDLPDGFYDLADNLLDYRLYLLEKEKDSETKYSYLRLYQLICIVQIQVEERARKIKIYNSLEENQPNALLLHIIKTAPGITFMRLKEKCGVSSEELRKRISKLEQDGFLSSRRAGDGQFYFLTNDGELLCLLIVVNK